MYTDHKNITCTNFNTDRVYRWRLVLEEYGPEIRYIKGEKNIAADALSRLPLQDDVKEELFNDFSEDLPPDAFLLVIEL